MNHLRLLTPPPEPERYQPPRPLEPARRWPRTVPDWRLQQERAERLDRAADTAASVFFILAVGLVLALVVSTLNLPRHPLARLRRHVALLAYELTHG